METNELQIEIKDENFSKCNFCVIKKNFSFTFSQLFPPHHRLDQVGAEAEVIEIFTGKSAETCSRNGNLNFKGKEKCFSSSDKTDADVSQ